MVPPSNRPPVTPRRFIIKKELPRETPIIQDQGQSRARQFHSTPRFAFPSTPRATLTPEDATRATASSSYFLSSAPKTTTSRDAIEEFSDDLLCEVEEEDDDDHDCGNSRYGSAEVEDGFSIEEPTPKRRRLSSPIEPLLRDDAEGMEEEDEEGEEQEVKPSIEEEADNLLSSSLPILSSPPTPKRLATTTVPRFLLSTPAPPTSSKDPSTQTVFLKPPRFRPPDPADGPQAATDPLPEQFSPHRKGQTYVPGGLAAEVRDWLVNIESAIPARKEEEWLVKVLIDEISGGGRAGMTLVRGRQVYEKGMVDTPGSLNVMLAGEGAMTGLQRGAQMQRGQMVGIKGPVWDVMVEGEKWGVGVDWKVLT